MRSRIAADRARALHAARPELGANCRTFAGMGTESALREAGQHQDVGDDGRPSKRCHQVVIVASNTAPAGRDIRDERQNTHATLRQVVVPTVWTNVAPRLRLAPSRLYSVSRTACSQPAIGVVKPVLALRRRSRVKAANGLCARHAFGLEAPDGPSWGTVVATAPSNELSTRGTRTSSECAMLAQSISRRS